VLLTAEDGILVYLRYKPALKIDPYQSRSVAGISVNLGHPQGRALKSTLNFLGRIPCLSLIGIDI
jgi:hypothetical protein